MILPRRSLVHVAASCRSLASQQLGMEPEAGVAYPLHLGASLLGQRGAPEAAGGAADEFCTLRYDFKPASAARAAVGQMDVQMASQKVHRAAAAAAAVSPKLCLRPSHHSLNYAAIVSGDAPQQQPPLLCPDTQPLPLPAPPAARRSPCRWRRRRSAASTSRAVMGWTAWPSSMAPPSV